MATTPEEFKVRFPEFDSVAAARIQLFIDDTIGLMGDTESHWHGNYDVAQCYLTAHLLVVGTVQSDGDSGVLAPIEMQEVDDVVIKQAVDSVNMSEGELGTTSYGKRYITYRRIGFAGFLRGV